MYVLFEPINGHRMAVACFFFQNRRSTQHEINHEEAVSHITALLSLVLGNTSLTAIMLDADAQEPGRSRYKAAFHQG